MNGQRLAFEVYLAVVQQSLKDVGLFLEFCNSKSLKAFVHGAKRSPSCQIRRIDKWHPTEIRGALDFIYLKKQSEITKLATQSGLATHDIHNRAQKYLCKTYGSHISFELNLEIPVMTSNGKNVKQQTKSITEDLATLTRQGTLEWKEYETTEGCAPHLISPERVHVGSFKSSLAKENGTTIGFTLSCYSLDRRKEGSRIYREYMLEVVKMDEDASIEDLSKVPSTMIRGAGRIWKMIEGQVTAKPVNENELQLSDLAADLKSFM